MEGLQKTFQKISKDPTIGLVSSSSSSSSLLDKPSLSIDQSQFMLTRSSGRVVSYLTCSKLCAFCFVAGVFVGYTLKRRVRSWASKLLKKIKD